MCVAWSLSWEENRPTEQNQRGNQNELQKITYLAIKKPKSSREGEGFNKDAVREIALLMELKRGTGVHPPHPLACCC